MQRSRMVAVTVIAGLGFAGQMALAGPCSDDIAKFEQSVRQSTKTPSAGPTAPQSVDAQLRHQPTPQSVKQAEDTAQQKFEAVLARAKALDQAGDQTCKQALEDAKLVYGTK